MLQEPPQNTCTGNSSVCSRWASVRRTSAQGHKEGTYTLQNVTWQCIRLNLEGSSGQSGYVMRALILVHMHAYLSKAYTIFRMLGGTISAKIGLLQQGPACSVNWQASDGPKLPQVHYRLYIRQ